MTSEGSADARSIPRPAADPHGRSGPLELVYIVGAHKSGATVLGSLLAQNPELYYGGELYRFPKPIFDPSEAERRCSCGGTVTTCPFWSSVRARATQDPTFLDALRRGQARFERWGRGPRTALASARHDPSLVAHESRMTGFLEMIAEEASAAVVVESSYSALRAWLYGKVGESRLTVRYLHLVRDGRGFLSSELALDADPREGRKWFRLPPVVIFRWSIFNALALLYRIRARDRYLLVRYEDLLKDPESTLRRIESFLGRDLSSAREKIARDASIPMRHVIAGNRLRLRGEFRLRRETGTPQDLPVSVRWLFWGLAGPLATSLGYGLREHDRRT